jgi:DNA-binding FadR family transcriptional regulator
MADAAGNPGKVVDADLDFHRALLGATHNQLVVQMERVIASGLAMRDQVVHNADPADDPVPSHRKVLDAIRDRDAERAEQAMRALVDKASEDLRRISGS